MIFSIATFLVNKFGLQHETAMRIARWLLVLAALLVFLASIYGWMVFKNWRLQGEIEREREARSQQSQEIIDEQKTEVNTSANVANQALQNVNKVENANFTNTNVDRANQLRCNAFKNAKGC